MGKPTPDTVKRLVDRFDQDRKVFLSGDYKEEQLRLEFLNPFFTALGWDMDNKQGLSETFKQVIHEETIRVAGASKAPDYTFRIGGRRTFFVEAKKPAVNVALDSAPAFQLRRYAWTARLPVSILSDFEEFAVYDCRLRPFKTDKPATARTMLLGFQDYATRWDELSGLFSPDAIQRGALERYVESTKTKKGTTAVDDAFLEEISRWREMLAKNIALRNPRLSTRELNFAVQRTIDRLIFLRICEDRGIESYAYLQSLLNGERVYPRLVKHFRDADDRYNSGLFHFGEEKDRAEAPDKLTLELDVDDKPLKDIIGNLYYPDSPYEFSVMPADVLGQVYEQFLGKVIRLTIPGHHARVEYKPEVRKAGGVYYTPTYIVDYIVKNTVGKLLEGKTPKEISDLRILDPACGSGSFLLGAYQYLLDWHLDWYVTRHSSLDTRKSSSPIHQDSRGNWRLTTKARKEILLNNIYGVDIGSQAVEVTKLSLLLKVLEGENQETLGSQLKLYHERALDDIGSNIKCGNSLIGSDFYQHQQSSLFDDEERYRINVFDWNAAFPGIMNCGGFDAVIGNPPYIDSEIMTALQPETRRYCVGRYCAASGNWDIFCVFAERAVTLCRQHGLASFIVPNKLLSAEYADGVRHVLAADNRLLSIRDYSHVPVFPVAVYPVIYVVRRDKSRTKTVRYERMTAPEEVASAVDLPYDGFSVGDEAWPTGGAASHANLLHRLRQRFPKLDQVSDITGAATVSEAYEMKGIFKEAPRIRTSGLRVVNSGTIDRFHLLWGEKPMRYLGRTFVRPIVPATRLQRLPTKRLIQAKQRKAIVAGMTLRIECSIDEDGSVLAAKSTTVIIPKPDLNLKFLCGILNSSLISFYYQQSYGGISLSGGYLRVGPPQLERLPVAVPNLNNRDDKAKHDKMVELVELMLKLHKDLPKAKTPHEQESRKRTIAATDKQIDALVYDLYGLTEDEIRVVEGVAK